MSFRLRALTSGWNPGPPFENASTTSHLKMENQVSGSTNGEGGILVGEGEVARLGTVGWRDSGQVKATEASPGTSPWTCSAIWEALKGME